MATTPRTALVTGSARGIGEATARRLHADGFRVVGLDRIAHSGDHLALVLRADLADPAAVADAVGAAGPVDVLVNNAAILTQVDFADITPAVIDETMAVNFRAPVLLAQGVLPHMVEAGWGRIISIASIAARTGGRQPSAMYAASKAALLAVTKHLAEFYGQYGVTANAIAPGGIVTEMGSIGATEGSLEHVPLRRRADPAEVASVVAFLAGEDASYVTGVTIDVNGGRVMV